MQMQGVIEAIRMRGKHLPDPVRVLVVDDDDNVRDFVVRALKTLGMETVGAAGGHEALSIATTTAGGFGLVVTDVRMPHMSGPEFIDRLRRTDPYVKVLYLTGFNDQLFREKIALWEDEAFLDKPCSIQGLLEAVSLLLHGRLPRADYSA